LASCWPAHPHTLQALPALVQRGLSTIGKKAAGRVRLRQLPEELQDQAIGLSTKLPVNAVPKSPYQSPESMGFCTFTLGAEAYQSPRRSRTKVPVDKCFYFNKLSQALGLADHGDAPSDRGRAVVQS
jgi:hypothetical protein